MRGRLWGLALMVAAASAHGAAAAEQPLPELGGWGQAWDSVEQPVPSAPAAPTLAITPEPTPASIPTAPVPVPPPAAPAVIPKKIAPAPSAPAPSVPVATAAPPVIPPAAPALSPPVEPVMPQPVEPVMPQPVEPAAPRPEAPITSQPVEPAAPRPEAPITSQPVEPAVIPPPPKRHPRHKDMDQPARITADQIIRDRNTDTVTAKGHVEVIQSGRVLTADQISYDLATDVATAQGHVVLTEPTGDVTFAKYMQLSGNLKNGVARRIRLLMADRSRLVAASATRIGGVRTDFTDTVYTPCRPCRAHPDRTPLWEAKAARVVHDQIDHTIIYHDAWLDFAGVPFAYTPYLSRPDPTIRRKSGFLLPTIASNSTLGSSVTLPYYLVLGKYADLTLRPRFFLPGTATSSTTATPRTQPDTPLSHVLLDGELRWNPPHGHTMTQGSVTQDPFSGDIRDNVYAKGLFDLNRTWRAGYLVENQSDNSYSDVYGYRIPSDKPWLTTRPYIEGFGQRDYVMAESYVFQGITTNTDNFKTTPIVLPHIVYDHTSAPNKWGATWSLKSDFLNYYRQDGTSAERLSNILDWRMPYITSDGEDYTLTTSLRGDVYHSYDPAYLDPSATSNSAVAGRIDPQIALKWRDPFINDSIALPQIITPVVMLAASPNGLNPANIPNEDSIDFQLNDTNVLRPNRLAGLDRVEGGLRGGYGLRWSAGNGVISAELAQGWRAHADSTFGPDSGFSGHFSDYVGHVTLVPIPIVSLGDRFELAQKGGSIRRNEINLSTGTSMLNNSFSYYQFDNLSTATAYYGRRQQLSDTLTTALTRYWSTQASITYDFTYGPLYWTGKAIYDDDCFAVVASMTRNLTYTTGYKPGYTVALNLVFKTLGQVPFNLLSTH